MATEYYPFFEITELQTEIMKFVVLWVREKKRPVPHKNIVQNFISGKRPLTIDNAIHALIVKGYIRKTVMGKKNQSFYVQLRTI